jgi:hypothetical protein
MNPADLIRKGVAKLNDWFEKTEREELEQRMEIAKGNPLEAPKEPRLKRPRPGRGDDEFGDSGTEAAGIAEIVPARRDHRTPDPNATPRPRQKGERPPTEDEFLLSPQGGEAYREKNRLVQRISATYSSFGDQIASAILQKCLMPDGVQLLVSKLGMHPIGDDELDHQQIVDYLQSKGTSAFCEVVGIRMATPVPSRGGLLKAPGNEADRHGAVGGEKVRMAQNMATHGKVAADSPVMKMNQTGVKPVNLTPTSGGTEEIHTPLPLPPFPRSDRERISSTTPPPPPSAQRPLQASRLNDRPLTPIPVHAPSARSEGSSDRVQAPRQPTPPVPSTAPPPNLQPVSLRGEATPQAGTSGGARSASGTGHPQGDPRVPPPGPDDPLRATPLPGRGLAKRDPADEDTAERKAADFLRDELDDDR